MPVVIVDPEQHPERAPPVFMVVVMKRDDERKIYRDRTWGWYSKFEVAEERVLCNATDMFEDGYYDLALIEEVPEGICSRAIQRQWYMAMYTNEQYDPIVEKIEPPEWSKGLCNFSIG